MDPFVMKTVPFFLRGVQDCPQSKFARNSKGVNTSTMTTTEIRGWKLFFLFTEDFVAQTSKRWIRPEGAVARTSRQVFARTVGLLEASLELSVQGAAASCRRRRGQKDTVERRAARAFELCQFGELSSARQALEGAALARGIPELRSC